MKVRGQQHIITPGSGVSLIVNTAYTLSLAAVVVIIVLCAWMPFSGHISAFFGLNPTTETAAEGPSSLVISSSNSIQEKDKEVRKGHQPCCLPFKFQAVITPLDSFDAHTKQILRLYRDWERRLQVMEQTTFDLDGVARLPHSRTVYDYRRNKAYRIIPGRDSCPTWDINSGMLEPCMPENATYLGRSYLGLHGNGAQQFDAFHFRRTDLNRSIDMMIAVTSDGCVPLMEHIKGTLGSGTTDTLALFSNLTTELPDHSVFHVPPYCQTDNNLRARRHTHKQRYHINEQET